MALALWLGMALAALAPASPAVWLSVCLPCAISGLLRVVRAADLVLLVAIAFAGAGRLGAHVEVLDAQRRFVDSNALHRVRGTVVGPPSREAESPLAILAVHGAAAPRAPSMRLRVRLPPACPAEWGDRVEALVQLEVPGPARNPGGLDPVGMANAGGVAATGRAFAVVVRESTGVKCWPRATVARWRRAIERVLASGLSPDAHELVAPLVTGDRSAMSSELAASLRAAGIVHVIALSGLHVSGMAGGARAGVAALGGGLRLRAMAGVVCALLYVGIAGPLPSLARAAVTESLTALAKLTGRAVDALQALAVTAIALLIVSPGWSGDLGFQLSCAATAGLIAGAHVSRGPGRWRGALRGLGGALGAQLAAAPLLLARMNGIAWAAPLTNLVAVPLAAFLLAAAWIAALWELILPGTGRVWFASCEALATGLRVASDLGAMIPHAFAATGASPALPVVTACSATLLLVAAAHGRTLEERRAEVPGHVLGAALTGGAMLLATIISAAGIRPLRPPQGTVWIVVLDVGQGDAIALGSDDGWCLVDAGPAYVTGDAGASRVLPFLRWVAVRRLNSVVLTHADRDHAGGMASVLREVPAATAWTQAPEEAARAVGPAGIQWRSAVRGDTLAACASGLVLWPPPRDSMLDLRPRNHRSLAMSVRAGGSTALLLADVDAGAEAAMTVTRAALLKVAHHGSRTSTTAGLLARARPVHAAISCGARNRYGHPDAGVLTRLDSARVRVGRTDREGALWYVLDASGARRLDWRQGEPSPGIRTVLRRAPHPLP